MTGRCVRYFFALLLLLSVGSCKYPECVESDNFGQQFEIKLESHYSLGSVEFTDEQGNTSENDNGNQTIRFTDSGAITDGTPLRIKVDGAWSPFIPVEGDIVPPDLNTCTPSRKQVANGTQYPDVGAMPKVDVTNSAGVTMSCPSMDCTVAPYKGAGKWFTNGVGLYMLLRRPTDPYPNISLSYMRNPVSPNLHIGAFTNEQGIYNSNNQNPLDVNGNPVAIEAGWRIFFKISDVHYTDNSGYYKVTILSGARPENAPSPYENTRYTIENLLRAAAEAQYNAIVSNKSFIAFVYGCLSLFIAFIGIGYLTGVTQMALGQVVKAVIQASLVAALISPQSWNFFSVNCFNIFMDLSKTILVISAGDSYNVDRPFLVFDNIIWGVFYNSFTWATKMQALFTSGDLAGFLFIIVFCFELLYLTYMVTYGVVLYLTCVVALAFLIVMFPTALVSLLFPATRFGFDAWVNQTLVWMGQSLLILQVMYITLDIAVLGFYRTLGFKSCQAKVFSATLKFGGFSDKDDYGLELFSITMFVPGVGKYYKKINLFELESLAWDQKRYYFCATRDLIDKPPYYKEVDYLYTEAKYWDPNILSNAKEGPDQPEIVVPKGKAPPPLTEEDDPWKDSPDILAQRDHRRITSVFYKKPSVGSFIGLDEVLASILFLIAMSNIFHAAPALAQYLAIGGRSLSGTSIDAWQGITGEFRRSIQGTKLDMAYQATIGRVDVARHKIGGTIDSAEGLVDKANASKLGVLGIGFEKGVNAEADEIIKRNRQMRFVHLAQDIVGGTGDFVADRAQGVGSTVTKAAVRLSNPLTAYTATAKILGYGGKVAGKFADGEGAIDVVKGETQGFWRSFTGKVYDNQEYGDESYIQHMSRVLDKYRGDDKYVYDEELANGSSETPMRDMRGGLPQGKNYQGDKDLDDESLSGDALFGDGSVASDIDSLRASIRDLNEGKVAGDTGVNIEDFTAEGLPNLSGNAPDAPVDLMGNRNFDSLSPSLPPFEGSNLPVDNNDMARDATRFDQPTVEPTTQASFTPDMGNRNIPDTPAGPTMQDNNTSYSEPAPLNMKSDNNDMARDATRFDQPSPVVEPTTQASFTPDMGNRNIPDTPAGPTMQDNNTSYSEPAPLNMKSDNNDMARDATRFDQPSPVVEPTTQASFTPDMGNRNIPDTPAGPTMQDNNTSYSEPAPLNMKSDNNDMARDATRFDQPTVEPTTQASFTPDMGNRNISDAAMPDSVDYSNSPDIARADPVVEPERSEPSDNMLTDTNREQDNSAAIAPEIDMGNRNISDAAMPDSVDYSNSPDIARADPVVEPERSEPSDNMLTDTNREQDNSAAIAPEIDRTPEKQEAPKTVKEQSVKRDTTPDINPSPDQSLGTRGLPGSPTEDKK